MVSSYFERITSDFERLTDQQWATELGSAPPGDVSWMQDLVVRERTFGDDELECVV